VRVARYGKDQKQATRRRILDTAARRFKTDGIDGSGIATLMADAGLTNGAFYAHFTSKDDLVSVTITEELRTQCEEFAAALAGDERGGMERMIREYLSPEHRDHPEQGCPSAALLDEICRSTATVKRSYTEGLFAVADVVAATMPDSDLQSARAQVVGLFAMLVGTLQMSRAIDDRSLSDRLLERGIDNALAVLRGAATPG
jgi:TetR/AcrR family transcriptional regulator, transcriptional repressor for nem operon